MKPSEGDGVGVGSSVGPPEGDAVAVGSSARPPARNSLRACRQQHEGTRGEDRPGSPERATHTHTFGPRPGDWSPSSERSRDYTRPLGAPRARAAWGTARVALPNVSTRRERRERTRPLAKAAFPILDEYEEEESELRKSGKDSHDDEAAAAAAARDADFLARLLLACGNDSAVLPDVIQVWYETRRKPFDARGDEGRAGQFLGTFLRIKNSYGNLFGPFRETTPAFDPVKAAEGRSRGWRD